MKQYQLNGDSITEVREQIDEFLKNQGMKPKDILRILLIIEEALLEYRDKFGENIPFTFRYGKEWGRARFSITIAGESFDPFNKLEDENNFILNNLLNNMGIFPKWQRVNGKNVISLMIPKKEMHPIIKLIIPIGLAIILGLLFIQLPTTVVESTTTNIINPFFDTFIGLLSAISGPLIFLSIAWGVYSIGDIVTFGNVGKKMIGRFLLFTLIATVVSSIWLFFLYPPQFDGKTNIMMDGFLPLYEMILDVFPDNSFASFLENSPMQIIFLAIVVGFAILVLGKRVSVVADFLDQCNQIVLYLMGGINKIIPIFIFISIFRMIIDNQFKVLLDSYKFIIYFLISTFVVVIFYTILVCIKKKLSIIKLYKKISSTLIITLSTASSVAAFSNNMETCEKRLGINNKITSFGIPLGQVIFMPATGAYYMALGVPLASACGYEITPAWIIMIVAVSVVLAVATPPVPGGGITALTIFFMQLNFPMELISTYIILDIILDFIITAANVFCLQLELVLLADKLEMIDDDVLSSNN